MNEEKKLENVSNYSWNDIVEMSERDSVRQRASVYIWGTNFNAMHHLVWEILNNAIDEALAWYGKEINITLNKDQSITIEDHGRGMPIEYNEKSKKLAIHLILNKLHAWGKFSNKNYNTSGWLNWLGAAVTNFLSKFIEVEVKRWWKIYKIRYESWYLKDDLYEIWTCDINDTGTKVTFLPDEEVFWEHKFDFSKIVEYAEKQSYLLPEIKITLKNEQTDEFIEFYGKWIESLLDKNNAWRTLISNQMSSTWKQEIKAKKWNKVIDKEIEIKYVVQYVWSDTIDITSFVNNIITKHGWYHNKWLERWIQKGIEEYIKLTDNKLFQKDKPKPQDYIKWLSWVLSIYYFEPEFVWQTKDELWNEEVTKPISDMVAESYSHYLMTNPVEAKKILDKIKDNIKLRKSIESAKEAIVKKEWFLWGTWKLKHCISKNPEECELYLVEWDSAWGCFVWNTELLTDKWIKTFEDLYNEYEHAKETWESFSYYVYCYNEKTNKFEMSNIDDVMLTKYTKDLMLIQCDYNYSVECTRDHRFLKVIYENQAYKEKLLWLEQEYQEIRNEISDLSQYENLDEDNDEDCEKNERLKLDKARLQEIEKEICELHEKIQNSTKFDTEWVEAKELVEWDYIISLDWSRLQQWWLFSNDQYFTEPQLVKSVTFIEKNEEVPVYDIEVRKLHNFALKNWMIVHNSASQWRNKNNQAILPLKGKVLNTIWKNTSKIMKNDEIRSIINSLWCWIWDDYDESKLRYHKVVIFSDLDPDWYHITALIITLLFKLMPKLFENWHVYKAFGPLYRVDYDKKREYIDTLEQKDELIEELRKQWKKYVVFRFKGLWEMNTDDIYNTMMDPQNRKFSKITIEDIQKAERYLERVMWKDTKTKFFLARQYTVDDIL